MVIIAVTLIICVTVAILFLYTVHMVNKPKVIQAKTERQERLATQERLDKELDQQRYEMMMAIGDGAMSDDVREQIIRGSAAAKEIEAAKAGVDLANAQTKMYGAQAEVIPTSSTRPRTNYR